ncbi:thioredoxin domain-containing protein [Sphingomonas sp. HF-S4]|uniref:Thioredoxin domain-containing protein n=1 Tax=Sphingomonas agrestis TaxID=3080540 RepID=A0ABU3YCI8_9SPHN|nr:thioredoxin domain-containing protein [Sphingomonas sp. HF-S4]MDV3458887.1 thioredoxin domain-containing protein [Sphingomonas sp. HF-S4]
MRSFLLLPLLALAACDGGGDGNSTGPVSSAPVANVAPPAGKQWADVVAVTPQNGYVQGNPNAPIKLIEYGSRTCPTCGRFGVEAAEPLRANYISTGRVSYEFRDFPLHGAPDLALALLNQCAGTEAFFPMLDQIFANQPAFFEKMEKLPQGFQQQLQAMAPPQAAAAIADQTGMVEFAKQRGIPEPKARQCLADQAAVKRIADSLAEGTNKGVNGTPSFFINDEKIDAALWADVEKALKAAGAR